MKSHSPTAFKPHGNIAQYALAIALVSAICLIPEVAHAAGGGGDEFRDIWDKIVGWMQGYIGKLISILFLLVGIGAGILQRSVGSAIPALAAALILYYGPRVIESIFGAALF